MKGIKDDACDGGQCITRSGSHETRYGTRRMIRVIKRKKKKRRQAKMQDPSFFLEERVKSFLLTTSSAS